MKAGSRDWINHHHWLIRLKVITRDEAAMLLRLSKRTRQIRRAWLKLYRPERTLRY